MDYNMMNLFNIPTLVDEYFGAVEDRWVNRATTGFYLLSHWSKFFLCLVSHFQQDSYKNCNDDKDIINCECTKLLLLKSLDHDIIEKSEEKYEAMDGIDQEEIIYLKISLDKMFNMSDVVITSLQEFLQ